MTTRPEYTVSKEALQEIRDEGGFARVSNATLRRLGVVRLHDPLSRTYRVVSSEFYGGLVRRVLGIEKTHKGYIFADDINRMRGLLAREDICTHEELDQIDGRARGLKRRGIPPIFPESLYPPSRYVYRIFLGGSTEERNLPSRFPAIDLILQYGAGTYLRHCRSIAAQLNNQGSRRTKLAIAPATADDVIEFRRRAFTAEGSIEPLLIREMIAYVEDAFEISDGRVAGIRANNEQVFAFLEKQLADLAHPPMAFDAWDGDPSVCTELCWYLRFAPCDRDRIVQAYLGNLRSQGKLRTPAEQKAFRRVAALWPKESAQVAREMGLKNLVPKEYWYTNNIDEALRTGDFKQVPRDAFTEEPWATDLLSRLEERFRRNCREAVERDRMALFTGMSEVLSRTLRIPSDVSKVPQIKNLIDSERLRVARTLSDEDFLHIFGGPRGHKIGQPKYREVAGSSLELSEYIKTRRTELHKTTP